MGDCHELQKIVGELQILLSSNLLLMSSAFLDMSRVLCYITSDSTFGLFTFQRWKENNSYECNMLLAEFNCFYYLNKIYIPAFIFAISGLCTGICGQKKLPMAALR